jgi:DNA-binding MarR family transcriptional regulator
MTMTTDIVDTMRDEWGAILPEVDTSPLDIFGRLRRINVLLQAESDRVLAVHDVSRADFDIISALERHQRPLTPTEIATATLTSAAGTTKRLHRLVKIGMITREPNPDDGRGSLISLTQRGVDIIPPILHGLSSLEHELIRGMNATQQRHTVAALRFILNKLDPVAESDTPPRRPAALVDVA